MTFQQVTRLHAEQRHHGFFYICLREISSVTLPNYIPLSSMTNRLMNHLNAGTGAWHSSARQYVGVMSQLCWQDIHNLWLAGSKRHKFKQPLKSFSGPNLQHVMQSQSNPWRFMTEQLRQKSWHLYRSLVRSSLRVLCRKMSGFRPRQDRLEIMWSYILAQKTVLQHPTHRSIFL